MKTSKLFTLAVTFIVCIALTACGTVRGAGQDIEAAGQAVQKAVK